MTNLNASMANNSALSNAECKYDYETITKSRYTGANKQGDVTGNGLIQDKISLVGNRFDDFGDGFCHLYKKSNCNKKESLKITDFICRNNKNDDRLFIVYHHYLTPVLFFFSFNRAGGNSVEFFKRS